MPTANVNPALENLLLRCLRVGLGERLIFIHDSEFRVVAPTLKSVASRLGIRVDTREIEYDGIRPLDGATGSLLVGSEYGVILFGVVHNIWHTPERRRAKYELGKRLVAFVCSPEEIGGAGSLADPKEIGAATRQLARYFATGMEVTVTTPGGSDFSAVIGTPFCEHGNYDVPGTGGDFPAGEVGFGPKLGSVNGHIVYDIKVQHIGLLQEPLHLQVEQDRISELSGPAAGRFRETCAARGDILNFISEISLGLNPLVGVSAASAYIPEEKTFGTLHCGHGGNASYGERKGPHLDGVMARPTVTVGGRLVMRDGVIVAGLIEESSLRWLTQKC
jgi:leucyl aminopeptidase (aminopeptidase T)